MLYGRCPICGAKGVSRERRLNGNDKCVKGHTYPSQDAIPEDEFTCSECSANEQCRYAFDLYNLGGDCLECK